MILIYTGNGKGKTCACVGQALRALGHGMTVAFGQFFKRDNVAGEQKMLKSLLGDGFRACGLGFFRCENEREDHRRAALDLLAWATERQCKMLVLDESLYALGAGLIGQEDLLPLVEKFQDTSRILVLSGRGLPLWLEARADIVSTLDATKHAFSQGIAAAQGVEF